MYNKHVITVTKLSQSVLENLDLTVYSKPRFSHTDLLLGEREVSADHDTVKEEEEAYSICHYIGFA